MSSILGADIAGYQCEVCDEVGPRCAGVPCTAAFQAQAAHATASYLEIRPAGAWGVGVFATRRIPRGTTLCEYTGRLLPFDGPEEGDHAYVWTLPGCGRVDAQVYGNVGRFVNHHCTRASVKCEETMYGRRKVLLYKTKRAVEAGEQLFVDYGIYYWSADRPCLCSAAEYPHILSAYGRVKRIPGDETKCKAEPKAKGRPKSKSKLKSKPETLTQEARVSKKEHQGVRRSARLAKLQR